MIQRICSYWTRIAENIRKVVDCKHFELKPFISLFCWRTFSISAVYHLSFSGSGYSFRGFSIGSSTPLQQLQTFPGQLWSFVSALGHLQFHHRLLCQSFLFWQSQVKNLKSFQFHRLVDYNLNVRFVQLQNSSMFCRGPWNSRTVEKNLSCNLITILFNRQLVYPHKT